MQISPGVAPRLILVSIALLLAMPCLGQESKESDPAPESVDLFDDDVELDEGGWPTLYFGIGATYLDADGKFAANVPNQEPVTIIDFDRVGLDETDTSYWFSMNWRSSSTRWGAWFATWNYGVDGERTWQDELELPNQPSIPAGASVISHFDTTWYILEATYSFWQTRSVDAGIGLGLHTVDVSTRLSARIDLADESVEAVQASLKTLAPLPNVMAYLYWRLHPRWDFVGRVGWFGLSYDKYDGQMTNAHVMLNFHLNDRFALGAAWQFEHLDLDIEKPEYTQVYDVDFDGPMVLLRMNF